MNPDLIPVVLVMVYMFGFVIVGILVWHRRTNDIESGSRLTQDISDMSTGTLSTWKAGRLRSYSSSISTVGKKASIYFRTDTVLPKQESEEGSCCAFSAEYKDFMRALLQDLLIFPMPILNVLDYVSDITMTLHFLRNEETRRLGYISLLILIFHRVASAAILGNHYGWQTGVLQFFDIEVFVATYRSMRRHRTVLQVIQLKILEGFYESFPELLVQSYYLVKDKYDSSGGFMIYASITLSLLSLSKSWLFSDEVAIPRRGLAYRFSKSKADIDHEQDVEASDESKPRSLSSIFRLLTLWAWRLGEIGITLCSLLAFANVISARWAWVLFGILLLNTFALQNIWPRSRDASWFYQVTKHGRSQIFLSMSAFGSDDLINKPSCLKSCGDEIWFYTNYMYGLFILAILWAAELNYSFWALPTFFPRKFVVCYYVNKLFILVALLTSNIVIATQEGERDISMLWNKIFNEVWWFYISGIFLFIFGGAATWLFVLDIEQYKKALTADPNFLLQLIESKQFTFIEKLMRNGVCSAFQIVEDANYWMIKHNVVPSDERAMENFVTKEAYCKLLYYLIRAKLVRIGPRDTVIPPRHINLPKYFRNWAVPALLYKCNHTRENSTRSYLAATVLSKLVEKRQFCLLSSKSHVDWPEIRNAGASLQFLRYHLKAPEHLFHKYGSFNCTAKQLYQDGFDLLFCLRADFSKEELVRAGFDDQVLSNIFLLTKDENGDWLNTIDHLKSLKLSGFTQFHKLNFTFEDLRATNVFTPDELLRYKQGFMLFEHISLETTSSSEDI